MARCPNKNTAEYKALQEVYKTELKTNNIINAWQSANDTDVFPTTVEAARFIKTNKAAYALKQRKFGESVINNLRRLKLIHLKNGEYVINNSYNNSWNYDEVALNRNKNTLVRYLEANNISLNSVDIIRANNTYIVRILDNMFTPKDMLQSSKDWDIVRSREVVTHLMRMFPQLKVKMVSVREAKIIHDRLPVWQQKKGTFSEVNSFYIDEVVYLIKGKVTDETLIEEMLHPFIDAIKVDNPELFNGLLAEAKINFPEMVQQITNAYNNDKNFDDLDRNLEIVTQALTRHFNNEYNGVKPTKTFLNLIEESLEWLMGIINNLHEYMVGKPLAVTAINKNAKFSDIAKLLNVAELEFILYKKANSKVRYSLSPNKKSIVDGALSRSNGIQKEIINKMFHIASTSKESVDSLSVNLKSAEETGTIVVLNQEDHTYIDITNNKVFTSATTAIKGKLTNNEGEAIIARDKAIKGLSGKELTVINKEWNAKIKEGKIADDLKLKEVQLNLDIGNDIDTIVESIVTTLNGSDINTFESTLAEMKILDPEQTREMFGAMRVVISDLMPAGSIAMSQIVVFDEATQLAGTADLVIIDELGKISILDLKTSKNSINKKFPTSTMEGVNGLTLYEAKKWSLPADSLLRQKGVERLSTKGQHNLQVNLYRRMFENMGYTVNDGDFSASTFHIQLDVQGVGVNQKYLGSWVYEKTVHHNNTLTETKPSENGVYVDMLIPATKENTNKEKLDAKISKLEESQYTGEDFNIDQEEQEKVEEVETENILADNSEIFDAIIAYNLAVEKAQSTDSINKNKVFSNKTFEQRADERANEQAYIHSGLSKGPKEQSRVYTALLRKSLERIREFTEYVSDPKNVSDPQYIAYVLNFNRFLATFSPLFAIENTKELNATQRHFVLNLELEVNKLLGSRSYAVGKKGLINDAIYDYVREYAKNNSNRQYGIEGSGSTIDDLIKELEITEDTNTFDLQTRDLSTSPDMLLALVNTLVQRQRQLLLDKVRYRESVIKKAANKLLKLSPGMSKNQIYDFMHVIRNGEYTGYYVKPIGQKFYDLSEKYRAAARDSQGAPLQYRDITNLDEASKEDIAYNKDVARRKRESSRFYQAERSDENGNRIDGEYYRYSEEFKNARSKFEFWQNNGTYGKWYKKSQVNEVEYRKYFAKYYNQTDYTQSLNGPGGIPTGAIKKNTPGNFVNQKYKEINEFSLDENGNVKPDGDMRSEQYKEIFDPTKTDALSIAQREFYELYVQYYEKELLTKLTDYQLNQMIGKNPLVMADVITTIKDKPSVFARMYARTIRTFEDFTSSGTTLKKVVLDENGNFQHSMPIFFTGSPRVEGALEEVQEKMDELKAKYKTGKINENTYKEEKSILSGKISKLKSQPAVNEISTDLATSLIKFSAMAEHYEVMGEIEDTLTAITRVVENREYTLPEPSDTLVGRAIDSAGNSVLKTIGYKKDDGGQDNTIRRLRHYVSMVYFEDEHVSKGTAEKVANALMGFSSLAYVAFNPFGNFNNYLMGRVNNNIEMLGSRFYSKKNYMRASKEYNITALPGIIKRTGSGVRDLADIATLSLAGIGKTDYDPNYANNKYEAFVDMFRMMDDSSDIRESGRSSDSKSIWERFKAWGYVMQDAAEYNVQTKVGIAMLMDMNIMNTTTGETMSLYDAFQYNSTTHENELIDGYTTIVDRDGIEMGEFNTEFKFKLHNNIREVNKQIHGNYAHEDRMVIQSHVLGQVATQFKKWVAPAIRARMQREYFDENLGWMEGRYKSAWSFLAYVRQQVYIGNRDIKSYTEGFLKEQKGYDGKGGLGDSRGKNRLFGFYRTMGEISIILSVYLARTLFDSILSGDDDDGDIEKRFKNITKLQADRLFKELIMFVPIAGTKQQYEMVSNPFAALKIAGSLGEAAKYSFTTPAAFMYYSAVGEPDAFYANSNFVYQNRPKKGQLKVANAWYGSTPILRAIKKWDNALREQKYQF